MDKTWMWAYFITYCMLTLSIVVFCLVIIIGGKSYDVVTFVAGLIGFIIASLAMYEIAKEKIKSNNTEIK